MRERVINNRFIGDLTMSGMRGLQPGTSKIAAPLAAASVTDVAISASRRYLAAYIAEGEIAQTLRDARALRRVGKAIRRLTFLRVAAPIGNYYDGLAMCREGDPASLQEAKRILSAVGDRAPALFRAKAWVAVGTVLCKEGDVKAGQSLHNEAGRIANSCGDSALVLPVAFHAGMSRAFVRSRDGDHHGALIELKGLLPIAGTIGLEFPALLHHFQNNLAIGLAAVGRLDEAQYVAGWLMRSPYLDLYPESRRTCEDIASRRRKPSRNIVFIGEPFTRAADESPAVEADEARNQTETTERDHSEAEETSAQTRSAEPTPWQATIAAFLLEVPPITIQPTIPSAIRGAIRASLPARSEYRPLGQGYDQAPLARGPPVT
jgi:hypothetical protein